MQFIVSIHHSASSKKQTSSKSMVFHLPPHPNKLLSAVLMHTFPTEDNRKYSTTIFSRTISINTTRKQSENPLKQIKKPYPCPRYCHRTTKYFHCLLKMQPHLVFPQKTTFLSFRQKKQKHPQKTKQHFQHTIP